MSAVPYRPEIDGLRAIAVLAVILYHAGIPFVTGGYVGVDVFFVISGFLITSLIRADLEAGRFSFLGFWARRARRILPALSVMVITTLVVGWFLLLPADYAMLGKHAAAQAVFASNLVFYYESGYFDQGSALKALLHTWSLAVEEQFYLLFPLGLYLLWKYARHHILRYILAAALISFGLCLLVMHNVSLAFYMFPFRMWELLAGAMLVYLPYKDFGRGAREVASITGLICILAPVFLYTKDTLFPGWAALPPCLGAALLIWSGGQTFAAKVLSTRPFVFTGKISYSLYLWHWPLIVFAKYMPSLSFTPWVGLQILAVAFVLAVLSWKYIETPLRQKKLLPSQPGIYAFAVALAVAIFCAGMFLYKSDGVPARLDPAVVKYAQGIEDTNPHRKKCDKVAPANIAKDKVCETAEATVAPSFILWGDSYADAAAPAFYTLSEKYNRNGYVVTHHGCPPILNYTNEGWEKSSDCHDFNQAVFDLIIRHNIKAVFLSANWNFWIEHGRTNNGDVISDKNLSTAFSNKTAAAIQQTVSDLKAHGVKVYLFADVPPAGFDVPRVLAIHKLYGDMFKPTLYTKKYFGEMREPDFAELRDKVKNMTLLDPINRMCDTDVCRVEYDGYSLYYNIGHISAHGADYLSVLFEPYFKNGFSKL